MKAERLTKLGDAIKSVTVDELNKVKRMFRRLSNGEPLDESPEVQRAALAALVFGEEIAQEYIASLVHGLREAGLNVELEETGRTSGPLVAVRTDKVPEGTGGLVN